MTEYLRALAQRLRAGETVAGLGNLSTGEYLWVAMAASRLDLLEKSSYAKLDEAWRRLGREDQAELVRFWENL
jgi:hypothetical protein